jgi:acetyl-CoA acetyltransferase
VPDNDIVILSAVRTAQGKFQGGLAGTPAVELAAVVMKEALDRAGVRGDQLDEVIFGNVIQAGLGQNTARQAELKAGIPDDVPPSPSTASAPRAPAPRRGRGASRPATASSTSSAAPRT